MDLGTVKKKIKAKEYTTLYKCAEDVRLVWSNCMTYNADGSDFFKLAEGLQKKWDIQFNKVLTDIGVFVPPAGAAAGAPPSAAGAAGGGTGSMGGALGASDTINNNNKVSLQEKRNMAKLLYQITKEDLGKVLVELEQKCPASLKRNATEDEIELNVDVIPATVMQELKVFTQSYVISILYVLMWYCAYLLTQSSHSNSFLLVSLQAEKHQSQKEATIHQGQKAEIFNNRVINRRNNRNKRYGFVLGAFSRIACSAVIAGPAPNGAATTCITTCTNEQTSRNILQYNTTGVRFNKLHYAATFYITTSVATTHALGPNVSLGWRTVMFCSQCMHQLERKN